MSNDRPLVNILAVEDDDVDHLTLERALKGAKFEVRLDRARTLAEAEEKLNDSNTECLLLDYRLPDGSGLDLLCGEGFAPYLDEMAIIMLTGENDLSVAVEAMKNGAHDYLPKTDLSSDTLTIAIDKSLETITLKKQLKQSQEHIENLAFFDKLTALPNRHVFEDRLNQLISFAKREKQIFYVAVLDMNGFKAINDNMGHLAGDIVLQAVADRLASVIRDSDTVARFGGDEFVLLLPQAQPMFGADAFSNRVIDAVAAPISIAGEHVQVGVSMGLSQYPIHGEDADVLVKEADRAMYQAKKSGSGWCLAGATASSRSIS